MLKDVAGSGGNVDYTLPVATAETLGGVKPVTKTEAMTQPVGVDANGALYTEPGKGGGSDYVLPVGGAELGGVKNGGNVTINADGTMTAPENEISGEQVSNAVSDWLDSHPEATTTVADRSINPDKTTWLRQVLHNILDVSTSEVGRGFYTNGTGTISQSTNSVSAEIPVKAGVIYRVVNITNIRWMDSEKAYLANQSGVGADRLETAPNGAAYAKMQYVTANAESVQVHEYIGEAWEYDTYKNLYATVIEDEDYKRPWLTSWKKSSLMAL